PNFKRMEVDVAMVHFLALGNAAGLRVARVVETAVIGQPGEAGRAGVRDPFELEALAAFDVHHVQRAELGAAFGQAVGQQAPTLGRTPPDDGYSADGAERVRTNVSPYLSGQDVRPARP